MSLLTRQSLNRLGSGDTRCLATRIFNFNLPRFTLILVEPKTPQASLNTNFCIIGENRKEIIPAAGHANQKACNHCQINCSVIPKLIAVTQQVINKERINDISSANKIRCFMEAPIFFKSLKKVT